MTEITIEMRRETVADIEDIDDIVREMRHAVEVRICGEAITANFADRIEAAYNGMIADKTWLVFCKMRAALKPVLACDIAPTYAGNPFACLAHNAKIPANAIAAVREAQRIAKSGGVE